MVSLSQSIIFWLKS